MASIQVFLLLSAVIYSASAVTNVQVMTALENFDKTLQDQLNTVKTQIADQVAAQQDEFDTLKAMVAKTIELSCDSSSCPNKPPPVSSTPAPALESSTPLPVVPECPTPAPAPACPAPKPDPGNFHFFFQMLALGQAPF